VAYFTTTSTVAVGDFNGDAKSDLAVGDERSATILLGNGDGTLQEPVSFSGSATSVAVGDFNADGKLDVADGSGDYLIVFLGNGDGTLQAATTYHLGSTSTSVAVGDINTDGKLDLVATSYSTDGSGLYTSYVNVLLGYGNGTLAAAQTT